MKHLLVLTLAVLLPSCATINYREHMVKQPAIPSKGLPPISIDDAASMIAISPNGELPMAIEASDYSRSDILDGIEAYWNRYAGPGNKVKARIIISSKINSHFMFKWLPAFLGGFTLGTALVLGLPTDRATANASVTIDLGDKLIGGSGHGSCYAGMYYPGDPDQCAFSKAVTDAVRNAVRRSF